MALLQRAVAGGGGDWDEGWGGMGLRIGESRAVPIKWTSECGGSLLLCVDCAMGTSLGSCTPGCWEGGCLREVNSRLARFERERKRRYRRESEQTFSTHQPHFAATVRRGTRLCILPPKPSHLLCLRRRIRSLISLEVPTPRVTVSIELDAASKTYWSLSIVSRRRTIFPMDSDWLASIECIPLSIASWRSRCSRYWYCSYLVR